MLVVSDGQEFNTPITQLFPGQIFSVIDAGERSVGSYIVNRLKPNETLAASKGDAIPCTNLDTGRLVWKPRHLMVHRLNAKLVTMGVNKNG